MKMKCRCQVRLVEVVTYSVFDNLLQVVDLKFGFAVQKHFVLVSQSLEQSTSNTLSCASLVTNM